MVPALPPSSNSIIFNTIVLELLLSYLDAVCGSLEQTGLLDSRFYLSSLIFLLILAKLIYSRLDLALLNSLESLFTIQLVG